MKNDRLEGTAIVSTSEATTAIPQPTADLIQKSFAENTMRNRQTGVAKVLTLAQRS